MFERRAVSLRIGILTALLALLALTPLVACGGNESTGTGGTAGAGTGAGTGTSAGGGGSSQGGGGQGGEGGQISDNILPAGRRVDWTAGVMVGVPGGIPTDRTHLIDVTKPPYNADSTGAADASPAIQAAIGDAVSGDVVYLPVGTYLLNGQINLGPNDDNITLRGDGDSTLLDVAVGSGRAIEAGSEADYQWNNPNLDITGSPKKGDTELTVGDTSALDAIENGGVGMLAHLSILNDLELPVASVAGFERMRRQISRIVAKTATTVTIFPPLYFDLPAALSPKLNVASYQGDFIGIEDMKLDNTKSKGFAAIWLEQCYGCWVKNVTSINTPNYHVALADSLQCEIRHCDLRERQTGGSNGAGILFGTTAATLVEDNIVYKIFPHLEINNGSAGNVFAYNFCEQNDVSGIMGVSIDSNHSPHNSFNLYEGNVASKFQSDGYFGSESEATLFRNWLHGTCDTTDQFGIAAYLNRFSRNFSLVGNVLGRTGYPFLYDNANGGIGYQERYIYVFGLPNIGNGGFSGFAPPWADAFGTNPGPGGFQELDQGVKATVLLKGNWNAKDSAVPASESLGEDTLPGSLYRSSKPGWFGDLKWPAFDPAGPNQSYEAIPAGYRYVNKADPPGATQGR
jgi:hypothetical protein